MILKGTNINIRAIEIEDLEFLLNLINDEDFEKMENGWNFPVSASKQQLWYENHLRNESEGRFIIETKEGKLLGYINIINIDWKNRKAHTGIKVANKESPIKGVGKEAVFMIMEYCFDELNLNRLQGCMLEYNTKSYNLYINKCGWVEEGRQRAAVYKNGKYVDLILVGILKSDYERMTKK